METDLDLTAYEELKAQLEARIEAIVAAGDRLVDILSDAYWSDASTATRMNKAINDFWAVLHPAIQSHPSDGEASERVSRPIVGDPVFAHASDATR